MNNRYITDLTIGFLIQMPTVVFNKNEVFGFFFYCFMFFYSLFACFYFPFCCFFFSLTYSKFICKTFLNIWSLLFSFFVFLDVPFSTFEILSAMTSKMWHVIFLFHCKTTGVWNNFNYVIVNNISTKIWC